MTDNEEFWNKFLNEIDEIEEKLKESDKKGKKEALEACKRIRELLK
jgi:hypothetical protein